MKLIYITQASYISNHTIRLTFNDGKAGDMDFSPYLNRNLFFPLRDINVFKDFALDGFTITWLGGRLDIAPETLYFKIFGDSLGKPERSDMRGI